MFFDTYASTSEPSSKKGKLPPIEISNSPSNVFDSIHCYLKENGYTDIVAREEYYDLFGIKDYFEVSFNIVNNNGKSLLQISVYSEIKKGKVKRKLKHIYSEMLDRFEKYL